MAYLRNPADVEAGIDASKTSYEPSGKEVISSPSSSSGSNDGVVMTEHGGVSTAFPEMYEDVTIKPPSSTITTSRGGGGSSGVSGTVFDTSTPFGQQLPSNIQKQPSGSTITRISGLTDEQVSKLTQQERQELSSLKSRSVKVKTPDEFKRQIQLEEKARKKSTFQQIFSDLKAGAVPYFSTVGLPVGKASSFALGGRTLFKEGFKVGAKKVLPQAVQKGFIGSATRSIGGLSFAIGEGVIGAKVGTRGVKEISKATAPIRQKELIGEKEFENVLRSGFGAERGSFVGSTRNIPFTEKQVQLPSLKGMAQNIPLVPLFAGNKEAFETGAREYLKSQGYTGKRLETGVQAALRQRKAGLVGEGVGVFGANVYSELVGKSFVSSQFRKGLSIPVKQAPMKLFTKAGFQIGKAGIVEGVASEVAMQEGRSEQFNLANIGIAGGLGFVSAGLIGGSIAATRLNRPTISKVIETGAYITDPFEKPADITAARLEKSLRIPIQTPSIIPPKQDTVQLTISEKGGRVKTPTQIMADVVKGVPVQQQPISSMIDIRPKAHINITPKIDTPINTQLPTQIKPNVPVDIPVKSNIPTNVPISVNIPTPISRVTIPPPVPLSFPLGSGKGYGKKEGVKFVNELTAGRKALSGLVSKNILPTFQAKTRTKKTKSNKRKRKRSPFDFAFPSFPF